MIIYNYHPITREYIGYSQAELDPEETAIQGKEIYLIPANATTAIPPKQKKDTCILWTGDSWLVVDDYRENYYKVDSDLNVLDITTVGDQDGFIVVPKALGEKIKANPENYVIDGDSIREKTEEEKQAEEKERINNLTMTPLDFIKVLESFGLNIQQINAFLESHLDIKMQLTYCNYVYCGVVKSFLPIEIEGVTITAEMIEKAFKTKG